MVYGVVMMLPGEPNHWINVGTLEAPAKSKMATAERRLLEQGDGVPKLPIDAGDEAYVQLVRLDALTDPIKVRARPTVLLEVVPPEGEAR